MNFTTRCPECGRPTIGWAFHTSRNWLRCALGHVFHVDSDPDPEVGP